METDPVAVPHRRGWGALRHTQLFLRTHNHIGVPVGLKGPILRRQEAQAGPIQIIRRASTQPARCVSIMLYKDSADLQSRLTPSGPRQGADPRRWMRSAERRRVRYLSRLVGWVVREAV